MPSVAIPEDVYRRLSERAAARHMTVDELVAPLLEAAVAETGSSGSDAAFESWKSTFDAWMAEVQKRASRYPPGFVVDDSRESIYEGCGE